MQDGIKIIQKRGTTNRIIAKSLNETMKRILEMREEKRLQTELAIANKKLELGIA